MANGAFWTFAGTATAKLIVVVAGIICAHILTQKEFGEYGIVRSTIGMFVVFGEAGLGLTATKYIAEYREKFSNRISGIYLLTTGFALCTGFLVASLVLFFSKDISVGLLKAPELESSIKMGAVMLFVAVLNGAQAGVLSGFEDFKAIAINTFWGSLAESLFMIAGAHYYGVPGAVLGYGVGFAVLLVLNRLSIRRIFLNSNIRVSINRIKDCDFHILYKFSLPATLSSMIIAPTYWICKTILTRECGFEEVAIYEASDQWRTMILFIPSAISQIVLPILASVVNVDKNKFWKVLNLNLILNGSITFFIAAIVIIFRPYLMGVYGSGYESTTTLVLLALSTIFSSLANVVGLSISSRSKMWQGFVFNLIWAIVVIALSKYFVDIFYGAAGIGAAILVAYIIHTILQLTYLKIIMRTNNN